MKNKKNVIFIVIDAVRSYSSGLDERDRLEVFDNLIKKEYFVFDKLVVSAPSSLMSSITMLTGLPSFSLAQNYNDFSWNEDLYNILPLNLKELGYDCYGLFTAKEMRDKTKSILPPIKKEFLPNGVNIRQKSWSNESLLKVVKNTFEKSIDKTTNPFFLMAWFNSRYDTQTSSIIDSLINYISKKSYYDDTLIIVTADHGYPDQRRGLTSDGPDLKKAGKPHDLIVTDDNISVPLAIRFPNDYKSNNLLLENFPNRYIKNVLSQESILPTIFEVLDHNPEHKYLRPERRSITSELIEPNDNPIRSDARFIFQPNRISSIRASDRKYVADRELDEEFCYDLLKDPFEKNRLQISEIDVSDLKNFYINSEEAAFEIWTERISNNMQSIKLEKYLCSQSFEVFYLGATNFINPVLKTLKKYNATINLYSDNKILKLLDDDLYDNYFEIEKKIKVEKALVFIEDTFNMNFVDQLKLINAQTIAIIDTNMNVYTSRRKLVFRSFVNWSFSPIQRMMWKKDVYKSHPALFFDDVLYIFKRTIFLAYKKITFFLHKN